MKRKSDIIAQVHANSDVSKGVIERVVQDFLAELINEVVAGNDVRIAELGIFKVSTRKAHRGFNPFENVPLEIPERKTVHLKFNKAVVRRLQEEATE